jgi:SAM-dependent methyltransferase
MPHPTHPAQRDTLAYYDANAEVVAQRLLAITPTDEYERFLAHLPPGAHILDAGCGIGRDSRFFIQQGYTVTACDGSSELARRASQFLGQPVLHLYFEDLAFQNEFNAIWASASLLHVPAAHLPEVFERLESALKPGGILYASFVYGPGEVLRNGLLFNDQTEATIENLLSVRPRFEIVNLWKTADPPPSRPDRAWLHVLLRKSLEF